MNPEQDFDNVVQRRVEVMIEKTDAKLHIGQALAKRWMEKHSLRETDPTASQPEQQIDDWFREYATSFDEAIVSDIDQHLKKDSDNNLLVQYENALANKDKKNMNKIFERIEASIYQPLDMFL